MDSKLQQLISLCKCGVYVTVNTHRDVYETAAQRFQFPDDTPPGIPPDVLAEMIARDTIVEVQCYPNTPIGFYRVFHYDLDAALTLALSALQAE